MESAILEIGSYNNFQVKKKFKNDMMNDDEKIFKSDALCIYDRNLINKYGYSLSI